MHQTHQKEGKMGEVNGWVALLLIAAFYVFGFIVGKDVGTRKGSEGAKP